MKMNDEYSELKLRTMIVPQQVRWPPPNLVHWERLHDVADEARERLRNAYMQMDEIDATATFAAKAKSANAGRLPHRRSLISKLKGALEGACSRRARGGDVGRESWPHGQGRFEHPRGDGSCANPRSPCRHEQRQNGVA